MIESVNVTLQPNGIYLATVTKSFAPEHGGGVSTISVGASANIHTAINAAKSAVTLTRADRAGFEASAIHSEGEYKTPDQIARQMCEALNEILDSEELSVDTPTGDRIVEIIAMYEDQQYKRGFEDGLNSEGE